MERTPTTRREFLKSGALGLVTGAMWLNGANALRAQKPPSRVVEVNSETIQREPGLVDGAVLRTMVEEGIRTLTGKRTAEVGWKTLVAANDVVAIKVNATVEGLTTHHLLVDEVVRGLILSDVPPENILIWDRFADRLLRYAYPPKPVSERGFQEPIGKLLASEGPENSIPLSGYDEKIVYESDADLPARRDEHGTLSHYSAIVTQLATRIISLPVLKVHPHTGLSGAMANLAFGAINNTWRFHSMSAEGMLMIADIWTQSSLKDKHILTIVDGLTGAYALGPAYDPKWFWQANRLFFGRDPVALDTVTLNFLNDRRREAKEIRLSTLSKETGYLRRAESLAIGTTDRQEIDRKTLTVS